MRVLHSSKNGWLFIDSVGKSLQFATGLDIFCICATTSYQERYFFRFNSKTPSVKRFLLNLASQGTVITLLYVFLGSDAAIVIDTFSRSILIASSADDILIRSKMPERRTQLERILFLVDFDPGAI